MLWEHTSGFRLELALPAGHGSCVADVVTAHGGGSRKGILAIVGGCEWVQWGKSPWKVDIADGAEANGFLQKASGSRAVCFAYVLHRLKSIVLHCPVPCQCGSAV